MTALADFIRTVFNTSQSAAPKLAPAHLGYRVHVHMEKNKAGCACMGALPTGCCQLCTHASTPAQAACSRARCSSARSWKHLRRSACWATRLMMQSPGLTMGLQNISIADPAC